MRKCKQRKRKKGESAAHRRALYKVKKMEKGKIDAVRKETGMAPEHELRWALWARLLVIPFALVALVESALSRLTYAILKPFMPGGWAVKHDPRLWPTSPLLFMLGDDCRYVKRNSTTWKALERLYSWSNNRHPARFGFLGRWVSEVWNQMENVRATRNRFRNTRALIMDQVAAQIAAGKTNIRIASVAAGSARAPIEAIVSYLQSGRLSLSNVKILLIDDDPDSFTFAHQLAESLFPGLGERLEFKRMKISQKHDAMAELQNLLREFAPDIIEEVGFTDYCEDGKVVALAQLFMNCLTSGGVYITNNVTPNEERVLLEMVVCWKMRNRTEHVMRDLFRQAGIDHVITVWEPTGIQPIYLMRKTTWW